MATSLTQNFSKEEFKKNVISNCKSLYRKNIEEANDQEVFQAVSYAVKDIIIDKWIATHKQYEKDDPKMVYYMSMEFLMGRALGNNMINLCAYDEIKEALDELGLDINVIEDQEPDAALGNGGLGRLAACFMDSLATLEYPAYGCGIRYKYGMFKQEIKDGYQVEVPDNWLKDGNPFEIKRSEYRYEVKFGGYVRSYRDEKTGRDMFVQEDYRSVIAVPYDIPVLGYGNNTVNSLRIWDAEPVNTFNLNSFDKGDYQKAIEEENLAMGMLRTFIRRLLSSLMIHIQQLQLQSLCVSLWMRTDLNGMRHGISQLRLLLILTIQLWLRHLRSGLLSYSQDFFQEFTRLLKRLTAVL